MCGICGIASYKNISQNLFESIRNLEYRGYDSCGIALLNGSKINVKKNIGTVDQVNALENLMETSGKIGIAHTRWATHGEVTKENTHPHLSCDKNFAVVHNGILSNYNELRTKLTAEGHRFVSQTDTEVVAHLVEKYYSESHDVEKAFIRAIACLQGTFALALISIYEKDKIFCAKKESPLILGIADESIFIGSDFNAFIEHTKNAVILDDGEYAVVYKEGYIIKSFVTGEEIEKDITVIEWDYEMAKKGGYPHYMLKEIYEQPQTVINAWSVDPKKIDEICKNIRESERVYLIGVGTTYYVSLLGQYLFSSFSNRFVTAISADEFKNLGIIDEKTFVLAVSQSGETYDTLTSLRFAKSKGAKTGAIINVVGSSIARFVDNLILQSSGPEICVISTKSALAQMIILLKIALECGCQDGVITPEQRNIYEEEIKNLPDYIRIILNEKSGFIHTIARDYCHIKNWLYLGRGIYYPVALESALKMKEVAYIHAEGMPGGFLKHGTIAMIDDDLYTAIFLPLKEEGELYSLTLSSAHEVKARKGNLLIIHFGEEKFEGVHEIILPKVSPVVAPFLQLVAAQLLAYFSATTLKRNIDKPRSLAKSVTVS